MRCRYVLKMSCLNATSSSLSSVAQPHGALHFLLCRLGVSAGVVQQLRQLAAFREKSQEVFEGLPFFRELRRQMKSSNLNGFFKVQAASENAGRSACK